MARRIANSGVSLLAVLLPLILLQLCLLATNARAQDLDDVTIAGRILDQDGHIIPGASITATLASTGIERSVTANEEGRYRFIELPPGLYTLRASFENFATEEKRNLATIAGQNVRLDFVLRPSDVIAEQVIISDADASPVDTSRTIVGGTVTGLEAEQLPLDTRSPLDLIFTLGGVTEEPLSTRDLAEDRNTDPRSTPEEAGTFALSGGPAYSNNLTIDGLDNNDDRATRERFQPSIEAVAEVQVITNQFSAEYGRASGGRVNIRTRGGSKQFHARAFYFFKDESLNSNTVRNNALGLKRLPLQEHDPGFTFSGPLIIPRYFGPLNNHRRDRTFFFAAFESDTTLDSALINTLVPVRQNSLFPLPTPTALDGRRLEDVSAPSLQAEVAPFIQSINTPARNNIFTLRLDHKFTEAHQGTWLYQLGRLKNLRQFGGGSRLADALQGQTRATDALAYSDDYVLNTRTVNQARLQLSRLSPAFKSRGDQSTPVVLINLNDPLAVSDATNRSGTLVAGSSTSGATARRETRFQFQDTLTNVRGAHSLKLGLDVQRINSTFIDLSDASGTFNFASAGDFLANQPSRFRQNFQTSSTQRNVYLGLFAQDEWRLRSNLLLSYGLRYERETILRDRNNFGPRFALAYDPFKSGKTVLRLGAAIFYNRALLRTIDDFTLGNQQLFFDTNILTDPLTGKLLTAEQRRKFIADNLHFPQPLTLDSTLVQQFAVRNTSFLRRLDPHLRLPESYQANLGFERELKGGFVMEANWTWNRGLHLWREFNSNAPALPTGYRDLTDFLLSRDFANFRSGPGGTRPLYNAASAGELIRFTLVPNDAANPNAVGRIVEFGVPVSLINLNSLSSSTAIEVALAALNELRPDPTRAEVEQLASIGNSFYHGLTLELRRRFVRGEGGLHFSFRAAYTLSHLIDDGIVNTSDALRPGDFRAERARSLLDRRHRFVLSGTFETPRSLGQFSFSPILRIASGAPFNISIGGVDRNLDDVSNDRPVFTGDVRRIRARRPGQPLDPALLSDFALPTIGRTGNLPRNAGIGPGIFLLDLNVTREFRLREHLRLRPVIEVDNALNKTVFSFGTEFINFNALGPTASAGQRQAFMDSFLVPTRTLRQRQLRVGMRLDF
ncbi:MAG: hypothetical protein QOD00_2013 [Blastocatellia bacterium]|jgi:outer membrane receptor protein involved in Fe transport|nr:hypothetical protein [Blastocatellia bacterium]